MLGEKPFNQLSQLSWKNSLLLSLFFLVVHKISGGETSKREDEPESGASQNHVAAGATRNGKNK